MICSIVRTVAPGARCSYPAGRCEVYFLAPYRPCQHSHLTAHDVRLSMRGRTWDETKQQAHELCRTFQNCCYIDGIKYSVEEVADDSPDRAPLAAS